MVEWGELILTLSIIAKSDTVNCAFHAKDNNFLGIKRWKQFARIANRPKKLRRLAHQAKLHFLEWHQSTILVSLSHENIKVPRNFIALMGTIFGMRQN